MADAPQTDQKRIPHCARGQVALRPRDRDIGTI
jgi:hypothetical protein